MNIEEALSRLAINTGRIADALEAISSSQGIVADPKPAPAANEDKPAPAKKKKTTKKKVVKKKASETKVGKETPEPTTSLTIKDDVRPVLKRLRDEVNHAAVKSLLKKYGASTIPTLDPKHYEGIIADALAELGDDDDDLSDFDDDQQEELDLDDDDDDL